MTGSLDTLVIGAFSGVVFQFGMFSVFGVLLLSLLWAITLCGFSRLVLLPEQIPSLVDKDGYFYHSHKIIGHLNNISNEELRAEVNARIGLLLSTGILILPSGSGNGLEMITRSYFKIESEVCLVYYSHPGSLNCYRYCDNILPYFQKE